MEKQNDAAEILDSSEFQGILERATYDPTHLWLLDNEQVAAGFGTSAGHIRTTKSNKKDELIAGIHWISVPQDTNGGTEKTYWTKLGVCYLGFLLRSERAKAFRMAASRYIVEGSPVHGVPFDGYPPTSHPKPPASEATGQSEHHSYRNEQVSDSAQANDVPGSSDTLLTPYLEQIASQIAPDATMQLLTRHIPGQIIQNIHRIYSGGATEAEQKMLEQAYRPIASLIAFESFVVTLKQTLLDSRESLVRQGVLSAE